MSFNGNITTGLLGYNLRKEFIGEGLFYREVELYNYTVYVQPPNGEISFSGIQNRIKDQFATIYSGDINVRSFDSPADYHFPNDSLRLAKFEVQIEVRRPVTNLSTLQPELEGSYYKGMNSTFINNNCSNLNNLSEEFSFEQGENGDKSYSHNVSFSIRTGGKNTAAQIASDIFSNDKDTTFGITAFVSGVEVANTDNYLNYYTETYDLIKNTYGFNKKREILAVSGNAYTYDLSHSLNLGEDGIINVVEKANVVGKLTFTQADQGASSLLSNSYGRCSNLYDTYKKLMGDVDNSGILKNVPLSTNKTLNRPNLSVNYERSYTDDPNLDSGTNTSIEKIIDVTYDGKYVNIGHDYNFIKFISPTYSGIDADYIGLINSAYSSSPTEIYNFYTGSVFYNSNLPTTNRVSFGANTPNRKKNFNVSFAYTNKPTNFFILDAVTYPFFDYKISDVQPVDEISEYQIINRSSKKSLINYAYQTKEGTKSIEISAKIERPAYNTLTSPISSMSTYLNSIYRFGLSKLLNTFNGDNVYALAYHLADVKYDVSSDNDIKMNIVISYSIKKYIT